MKSISVFLLLVAFNASFAAKPDPVVAVINGKQIKLSYFEKKYKENLLFVSDKVVSKQKVIDDLINRELGIQRAKKQNIDSDPVVKDKIEDVMYHAQVSKDLEPRLKKIVVTEDDVKAYYQEHPEYRTAHILFRMQATPEENELQAAMEQSLQIYQAVKQAPDRFSEFANKYSQSSVAPNGGDLGFQPAIRLAPQYFAAIKGKANGYISPPIRTQFGYHIIKVLAVKPFSEINMPLYKKIVYDRKRDDIMANYFKNLRKGASIKIEKKFLE